MTRVAPVVPAESDLLCEFCGYTLNGLSEQSNCPECGMPIQASLGQKRHPPLWEQPDRGRAPAAFFRVTSNIIFHPTAFFTSITTRGDLRQAAMFGHAHWVIASMLFGIAGSVHIMILNGGTFPFFLFAGPQGAASLALISYLALWMTTRLAVRLTAWEAAYRGLRLPHGVVMRGMYYHAAHYLPVAIITSATVVGYRLLLENTATQVTYLYILCGEIVVAAGYLFKTYWIGMRNMMYANR